MSKQVFPVIMSGGSGTRLWPLSRRARPKQFLSLISEHSLLQETLSRLDGLATEQSIIICNEEHRFLVAEQLRQLNQQSHILLEPVGRNTAPAIALAAFKVYQQNPDGILLVLAADHAIKDIKAFHHSIQKAVRLAEKEYLVTFGVLPTSPEIGYGYIKRGESLGDDGFKLAHFAEKPSFVTAKQYLDEGSYYWNSGMFVFAASTYLQALQEFQPAIYETCKKAMAHTQADIDFIRIDAQAFEECPADSIDYAVMEKTDKAAVVALDSDWSDIGSWSALWNIASKDKAGNVGKGDVLFTQTKNTLVYADNRLVTTLGVEDLVIVETKDVVLVASKEKAQEVKTIVEKLQQQERSETINHTEVYRPWGMYDSVDIGERYQVKRITVKPGAKLSLQKHHHRAEHWVIVKGTAKIIKGDTSFLLTEDQSVYIPIGEIHSLENPGKIPLELIEVQSGSYLGEDDIIRFEDKYGR